jgi:hypothetical protein
VNLDNVTRDDWIVGGLALLLAIDLLFFPWFDITVGAGVITLSATFTATGSPDGWLGVVAMLCALAVVADLAVERLSPQTHVPAIGDSRTTTRFVLAAAAAACLALKFLLHIHFSLFGWGFYFGVAVVAALVYFAAQARRAEPRIPTAPTGTPGPTAPAGPAGSSRPPTV